MPNLALWVLVVGLVVLPPCASAQSAGSVAHAPGSQAAVSPEAHTSASPPAPADPHTATPADAGAASAAAHGATPPQESATAHDATGAQATTGGHGAAEEHGESLFSFASRIINFLVLAWLLWWVARKLGVAEYFAARTTQIRQGLVDAADMRARSAQQLSEIETRMRALPDELDALKARGAEEIAAEEARIRQVAAAERERLLEQARRDIDLQLQAARRELTRHAADLAVDVAASRLKTEMTDEDQKRLVDRYVSQVKTAHD